MRRPARALGWCAVCLGGLLCLLLELFVIAAVLLRGLPELSLPLLLRAPSALEGRAGLLPQIINTLYLTVLTLALALPIGVGCALHLNWYAQNGPAKRLLEVVIGALAGIPSAVYGLFGFLLFGSLLGLRYSILSGAATLSVMVLPTAIKTAQSALESVPRRWADSAVALGATDAEAICSILLPCARRGIASAALLAAARVAGESAALLLTAGVASSLPSGGLLRHLFSSGATLAVGLYQSVLEGDNGAAFAAAAVLLGVVWLLDLAVGRLGRRKP